MTRHYPRNLKVLGFVAAALGLVGLGLSPSRPAFGQEPADPAKPGSAAGATIRVAAAQAKPRTIDWRLKNPTMGTAAIGEDDIGVQALCVRAAENFVWVVVAHRGHGARIISPQGKIIARAEGSDGLAIADIDPHGGREGGDAMNWQRDMRARLFRERNPEVFGRLTEPNPPVLAKVPIDLTREEAGRLAARVLTVGEQEFKKAQPARTVTPARRRLPAPGREGPSALKAIPEPHKGPVSSEKPDF